MRKDAVDETEVDEDKTKPAADKKEDVTGTAVDRSERTRAPRTKFVFEEDGEPPQDEEEEAATTLDRWKSACCPPWQLHSELGPNFEPHGPNVRRSCAVAGKHKSGDV